MAKKEEIESLQKQVEVLTKVVATQIETIRSLREDEKIWGKLQKQIANLLDKVQYLEDKIKDKDRTIEELNERIKSFIDVLKGKRSVNSLDENDDYDEDDDR